MDNMNVNHNEMDKTYSINLLDYIEEECYNADIYLNNTYLDELFKKLLEKIGDANILNIKEYINYCINMNNDSYCLSYSDFLNDLTFFVKLNLLTEDDIIEIKNDIEGIAILKKRKLIKI